MATPTYQGNGQPSADSGGGWFGRVSSFFGGGTPTYQSAPMPKPPEPSTEEIAQAAKAAGGGCGPIAIIVPRPGCMSESETSQP